MKHIKKFNEVRTHRNEVMDTLDDIALELKDREFYVSITNISPSDFEFSDIFIKITSPVHNWCVGKQAFTIWDVLDEVRRLCEYSISVGYNCEVTIPRQYFTDDILNFENVDNMENVDIKSILSENEYPRYGHGNHSLRIDWPIKFLQIKLKK